MKIEGYEKITKKEALTLETYFCLMDNKINVIAYFKKKEKKEKTE